jgi:hypothetical protein
LHRQRRTTFVDRTSSQVENKKDKRLFPIRLAKKCSKAPPTAVGGGGGAVGGGGGDGGGGTPTSPPTSKSAPHVAIHNQSCPWGGVHPLLGEGSGLARDPPSSSWDNCLLSTSGG